jgi:hypothetical protein
MVCSALNHERSGEERKGGRGTFTVTLETAGTQSITATDVNTGIAGVDTDVVSPAAASQVVFTQEPSCGTDGQTSARSRSPSKMRMAISRRATTATRSRSASTAVPAYNSAAR